MFGLLRKVVLASCLLAVASFPAKAQISNLCTTDSSNPPVTTCTFQNNSNTGPTLGQFTLTIPGGAFVENFSTAPGYGFLGYVDPTTNHFVDVTTIVNGISFLTDPDAGTVIPPGCETVNGQTFCFPSVTLNSSWSTGSTNGYSVGDVASNNQVQRKVAFSYNLLDPSDPLTANSPTNGFNKTVQFIGNNFINVDGPGDETIVFKYRLGGDQYSDPEQADRVNKLGIALSIAGVGLGFVNVGLGVVVGLAGAAVAVAGLHDPPDLNYTVVVTPTPPAFNLSGGPAAQQLIQNAAQITGLANAISTTTDRITGASLDGDPTSQQMQMTALTGFETQLDAAAALLPAQLVAVGQELAAGGFNPASVSQAQLVAFQQSIATNGLPGDWVSILNGAGIDQATQTQMAQLLAAADPVRAESAIQNLFNIGPLAPPALSASTNLQQFASILPASRSVQVGSPATAFATIINAGSATANSCVIAPNGQLPVNFVYQTTNPATNAVTGTPNTPVNIPAGGSQSFVIAVTPTSAQGPVYADFGFFCANANAATSIDGVNTLLLSGSTTPVPDIVALVASGDPGIVDIQGTNGAGAFAVATVNVGTAAAITATANTGSATLPVSVSLCQTNPSTGQCLASPSTSVTTTINAGDTPTFGIFVSGSGAVPFDPANNRIFVQFADSSGVVHGLTSVAVRTQ